LNTISASGTLERGVELLDVLGAGAREVVEPLGRVGRDRRERGDGPDAIGHERSAGERVWPAA
jgi:hypothetical protein